MSTVLDDAFTIPGTNVRIGWDGLIGLLPVVGDILGAVLSLFIVFQGLRLKAPKLVILKMLSNIAIELLAGMVPVLGDLFDISWRANKKNYTLLERHIDQELHLLGKPQPQQSSPDAAREQIPLIVIGLVLAALILLAAVKLNMGNLLTLDQLMNLDIFK